jgi:hypothetical protein
MLCTLAWLASTGAWWSRKAKYIRREQLFAARPPPVIPECTTANDNQPSPRTKGLIRGFLHQVWNQNKTDAKQRWTKKRHYDLFRIVPPTSEPTASTWASVACWFHDETTGSVLDAFRKHLRAHAQLQTAKVGSVHLDQVIGNRGMLPFYKSQATVCSWSLLRTTNL